MQKSPCFRNDFVHYIGEINMIKATVGLMAVANNVNTLVNKCELIIQAKKLYETATLTWYACK